MVELDFSVDLQAELRKITQKQYLNQVHYLIQIVRHALNCHPQCIRINAGKHSLRLEQDGSTFAVKEWQLLQALTSDISDEEKQKALVRLESEFGVAFLSILLNFPRVYIGGPTGTVSTTEGKVTWGGADPERKQGYYVDLIRPEATGKDELEELLFYAGGVSTPILYNRKPINSPLELTDQILITRFQNSMGHGAVGMPEEGEFCHITLYKQGVRVGMKQFIPEDGRIYHAFWNAGVDHFESDYQETISSGDKYIEQYSKGLYAEIPNFFDDLDVARKDRIKKIILSLDPVFWTPEYYGMSLFHSATHKYALSLRDLEALDERFDGIPFVPEIAKHGPNYLPRLCPEDIHFLEYSQNMRVKRILRQTNTPEMKLRRITAGDIIAREDLRPDQARFLEDLDLFDPFCRFEFSRSGFGLDSDNKGRRVVCTPHDHPVVAGLLRAYRLNPATISCACYRLLALASSQS